MFPALLIVHFEISIVSTLISLAGHRGNLVGNNIDRENDFIPRTY